MAAHGNVATAYPVAVHVDVFSSQGPPRCASSCSSSAQPLCSSRPPIRTLGLAAVYPDDMLVAKFSFFVWV